MKEINTQWQKQIYGGNQWNDCNKSEIWTSERFLAMIHCLKEKNIFRLNSQGRVGINWTAFITSPDHASKSGPWFRQDVPPKKNTELDLLNRLIWSICANRLSYLRLVIGSIVCVDWAAHVFHRNGF